MTRDESLKELTRKFAGPVTIPTRKEAIAVLREIYEHKHNATVSAVEIKDADFALVLLRESDAIMTAIVALELRGDW